MSLKHSNISIFVPHIGCPNMCSFCNQRHITGTFLAPHTEDVIRAVEESLKSGKTDPKTTEIAFFAEKSAFLFNFTYCFKIGSSS